MAHRREHEQASGGQHAKTWAIGSALALAVTLAVVAVVAALQ